MAATEGKALVIDDDPDMRYLVRSVLEIEGGFACDEASDAFHALELWHTHRHEVVVTDQRMPGVTGVELAEVLIEEEPDQVVILFTAYIDGPTIDEAHDIGVCAVLSKDEVHRLPGVVSQALAS